MAGQAIRRHLTKKMCACLMECYKGDKKVAKTNVSVGDFRSWCEGCFAGIDVAIDVQAG